MKRKMFFCMALAMLLTGTVNGETLSRYQAALIEALKGDPAAQNKVGSYSKIGIGTERNDREAARWYRAAAEQGYAEAQFNLGEMYEEGRGVKLDLAEALDWYRKACDNGWQCGCRKYRMMTENHDSGCN